MTLIRQTIKPNGTRLALYNYAAQWLVLCTCADGLVADEHYDSPDEAFQAFEAAVEDVEL